MDFVFPNGNRLLYKLTCKPVGKPPTTVSPHDDMTLNLTPDGCLSNQHLTLFSTSIKIQGLSDSRKGLSALAFQDVEVCVPGEYNMAAAATDQVRGTGVTDHSRCGNPW